MEINYTIHSGYLRVADPDLSPTSDPIVHEGADL